MQNLQRYVTSKKVRAFPGSLTVYGFGLDQNDDLSGVVGARKVTFVQNLSSEYPEYHEARNPCNIAAYSSRYTTHNECTGSTTTAPKSHSDGTHYPNDVLTSPPLPPEATCHSTTVTHIDGGACSGDSGGPILGNLNGTNYVLAVSPYNKSVCDRYGSNMFSC